jgi:hypothetical protein
MIGVKEIASRITGMGIGPVPFRGTHLKLSERLLVTLWQRSEIEGFFSIKVAGLIVQQ